jgi:hypothetical protein
MGRNGYLVLILFLMAHCKKDQYYSEVKKSELGGEYIEFYNKRRKARVRLHQYGVNCLNDSLVQSFQDNLVKWKIKKWKFDLSLMPFVSDSTSCEGIYIYRIRSGAISARYVGGAPHYFCAIDANEFLFFDHENMEENKKKLDRFKGSPLYPEMLKYEKSILKDLILIK